MPDGYLQRMRVGGASAVAADYEAARERGLGETEAVDSYTQEYHS